MDAQQVPSDEHARQHSVQRETIRAAILRIAQTETAQPALAEAAVNELVTLISQADALTVATGIQTAVQELISQGRANAS